MLISTLTSYIPSLFFSRKTFNIFFSVYRYCKNISPSKLPGIPKICKKLARTSFIKRCLTVTFLDSATCLFNKYFFLYSTNKIFFIFLKKKILLAIVLLPDACGPVHTINSSILISHSSIGPRCFIYNFCIHIILSHCKY